MSFSRNFIAKSDFSGKKKTDNKINIYQEELPNPDIYKRDVFPQFSEPDEFSSALCSTSNRSQQGKKNDGNERKSSYFKSGNGSYKKKQSLISSNLNFPTFREYITEEIDDDEEQFCKQTSIQEKTSYNSMNKSNIPEITNYSKTSMKLSESSSYKETKHETVGQLKNEKELIGTRTRYLIGTIDQVIRWYKMVKNAEFEIHYEVAGVLESKIKKDTKDLLFIRSESGHILQGLFYNIDRELPDFQHGTAITATGNMIGSNKLQIFDASEINRDDFISIQRLAFLSQRSLQEAIYNSSL